MASKTLSTEELFALEKQPQQGSLTTEELFGEDNTPADFSFKRMAQNVPSSAVEMGKNLASAVVHPADTVTGFARIAAGGLEKILPESERKPQDIASFDSMTDFFRQRYGGMDELKRTIENDPVGFLADLSTVVSGAGGLVSKAGEASKIASLAKAGGAVSKAAEFTEPISLAMKTAGGVAKKAGDIAESASSSMANRFFRAPKDIAESRLRAGKLPIGEEVLNNPELANLRINDKKELYNRVQFGIKNLDNQIKQKIEEISSGSRDIPARGYAVENVPEREVPFSGWNKPVQVSEKRLPGKKTFPKVPQKSESYYLDEFGVPVKTGESAETLMPSKTLGQRPSKESWRLPEGNEVYERGALGEPVLSRVEPFDVNSPPVKSGGTTRKVYDTSPIDQQTTGTLGEAIPTGIKPEFAIRTKDLVEPLNSEIAKAESVFGSDSRQVSQLKNFRDTFLTGKPEYLDFQQANSIRSAMGEEVGKAFNKLPGDISNTDYAMKTVWENLRNKIGEVSPELSDLLDRQHRLIEIRRSVIPEAARGYGDVPQGVFEAAVSPVSKNIGVADYLNRGRAVPEAVESTAKSEFLKRVAQAQYQERKQRNK